MKAKSCLLVAWVVQSFLLWISVDVPIPQPYSVLLCTGNLIVKCDHQLACSTLQAAITVLLVLFADILKHLYVSSGSKSPTVKCEQLAFSS